MQLLLRYLLYALLLAPLSVKPREPIDIAESIFCIFCTKSIISALIIDCKKTSSHVSSIPREAAHPKKFFIFSANNTEDFTLAWHYLASQDAHSTIGIIVIDRTNLPTSVDPVLFAEQIIRHG